MEQTPTLQRDTEGLTALHEAAQGGHLQIVRLLVKRGAEVNALTAVGKPPLHLVLIGNHTDVAQFLTASGAAPGEVKPVTGMLAAADVAAGEETAKTLCTFMPPSSTNRRTMKSQRFGM